MTCEARLEGKSEREAGGIPLCIPFPSLPSPLNLLAVLRHESDARVMRMLAGATCAAPLWRSLNLLFSSRPPHPSPTIPLQASLRLFVWVSASLLPVETKGRMSDVSSRRGLVCGSDKAADMLWTLVGGRST